MRAWQFANARRYNVDDCRAHGIHAGACREVESAFRQILNLAKATDAQAAPDRSKSTALRHCILAAFADQLCVRRDSGTLFCNLTDGRSGTLVRESVVQKSPLLVIGEIRQVSARGDRAQTLLSLAAAVELDWVRELFPGDLTTRAECGFDPGMKRVEAHEITRFRDLELAGHGRKRPIRKPPAKRWPRPVWASGSRRNRSTTRSGNSSGGSIGCAPPGRIWNFRRSTRRRF